MNESDLVDVAHAYYVRRETMTAIGRRLGVSRSTVSRMLDEARSQGVVQITVRSLGRAPAELRRHLDRLGVTCHVVDVRPGAAPRARLEAVARTAGHLVSSLMDDGHSLGIAWGTTTSAVVDHLQAKPLREATVVQLNGAASSWSSGITYAGDILTRAAAAYDAHAHQFPTPAFFDDPEVRRLLWRETSVRRILELQRRLDVALFGVGSLTAELPSHVYAAHYLTDADLRELREQEVVGDVCTVFVREDGTHADIALNERASGPTPEQLRELPRRVCAVSGPAKVPALVGVVRSRAITDLVVDTPTAAALVRHLDSHPRAAARLTG
ncbi:sugar-binding transcriptional regulator [Mobilicoccus massiliensis]|uniref:sugar-binding transcriptional regulator n=1 Tax=Mobilicoccus massiliensis TaxID=1522310 RepID=UPI00058C43A1|nr:sugar-binding domain-containing protein [Mobilicoccus massiliensis]